MAVYLLNRLPTSAFPNNSIPYESLYSKLPPSEIVHTFGCDVFVLVQEHARTALDATAKPCYYLGPASGTKDMFYMLILLLSVRVLNVMGYLKMICNGLR